MAPTRCTLMPIAFAALVIVGYSRGTSSVQCLIEIGRAVPGCGRRFVLSWIQEPELFSSTS